MPFSSAIIFLSTRRQAHTPIDRVEVPPSKGSVRTTSPLRGEVAGEVEDEVGGVIGEGIDGPVGGGHDGHV